LLELHLPTKKVRLRSTPFDDFLSLRWEQRSVSVRIRDLRVTETIDDVVIYHPDRLHVRIHNCRSDETESPVFEILAECLGFVGTRRYLPRRLPAVEFGLSADEPPAVRIKIPELLLDFE
jgi:hypothetical protein